MSFKFSIVFVLYLLFLLKFNKRFIFLKSEKIISYINTQVPNYSRSPPFFLKKEAKNNIKKCYFIKGYRNIGTKTASNAFVLKFKSNHSTYTNNAFSCVSLCSEKKERKKVQDPYDLKAKKKEKTYELNDIKNNEKKKDDIVSEPNDITNDKLDNINNNINESRKLIKGEYYDVEICEILSKSFLSYANFLILNRCLCDYRDGLKTVQRRIIWSMYEINKGIDKKGYKKCARIVGEVIGKYHPHGDKSVYDALVRLAQKHHNNNLLIKGYGNFGSVEYNAAAMRYTEAKISSFCYDILLDEINDENIEYIKNFDGNEREPKVLCSKIPLLLINGCSGIAVSILSSIPCHNLIDVANCCINFLINENITDDELYHIIKGPDFSTGGIIISKYDILRNIYNSGKGNFEIRSNVFFEYVKNDKKVITKHINDLSSIENSDIDKLTKKIIIKNLPPNVKPNELIENIINLLNDKKNEHDHILLRIRDESEKEDMRIVLELKKHSQIEQIHNFISYLFKYTNMQISYHCNFVCIGYENTYTQFSLKSFIQLWCNNRINFIKKNYEIKNKNLQKQLNIIDLYLIIQNKILDIITFFQKNQNIEQIQLYLKNNFKLNPEQIKYILSIKLQKLINIKNIDFISQRNKILQQIKLNDEIINNVQNIKNLIIHELIYIKNKYGIHNLNKQSIIPSTPKYKYSYINNEYHPNYFKNKQIIDTYNTVSTIDNNINENNYTHDLTNTDNVIKDKNVEETNVHENIHISSDISNNIKNNDKNIYITKNQYSDNMMPYRNTYIDSLDNSMKDIYNNDEVLILITYGGYIKKIKINEKLKNHSNNIIKLSNVKYILKENEEKLNENNKLLKFNHLQKGDEQEKYKDNEQKQNNDIDDNINQNMKEQKNDNINIQNNNNNDNINIQNNDNDNNNILLNEGEYNSYKIKKSILVRNRDKILLTDNYNKAFLLNVYDLHLSSYDSKGTPINQIIHSSKNITGITKFQENKKYLIVCSENGKMKVINNDVFLKRKKKGIKLFKNKKNIYFSYCNFNDNCIVGTKNGYIIQFPLSSFKISKKNSLGNKCISLGKNDKVVDLLSYENNEKNMKNYKIIFVTKNGFGKMINLNELKIQKKKGKGHRIMKFKKPKTRKDNKKDIEKKKSNVINNKDKDIPSNKDDNNIKVDEFLGFKLYDMNKQNEKDILIMITDHAVLIRKNMSLLKEKNKKHSSQIYAKMNKINQLVYFDII
ncbi:DNA gyrase subunit A [Plasmodium sp. DRC-Itaito]|nr:DNA gyrase subunit A [Plasmodium sp. DRC-Itaito]